MSGGGLFRGNSRKTKNKLEMPDYLGYLGLFCGKTQYLSTFQRFFSAVSCQGMRKNYICIEFG
jgi:hypothetical protein